MPKVEESKYDLTTRKPNVDSYEGRILTRTLSNRILSSKKATDILVYVEDVLYHWYDSTRLIKKSVNWRAKIDDKSIDG
jgi:hypothetical protein